VERHEERYDFQPSMVDWEEAAKGSLTSEGLRLEKEKAQDAYIFGLGDLLSCLVPPGESKFWWKLKMSIRTVVESLRHSPELSDELSTMTDEQVSTMLTQVRLGARGGCWRGVGVCGCVCVFCECARERE
jgi:hypothetical protein